MHLTNPSYCLLLFALTAHCAPTVQKRAHPASQNDFDELQRAAQLSSAAYDACKGQAFDVTITKQLNDALTDTQGFVGYSTSRQRITVVNRGSTSPKDFVNDLDIIPTTPELSGVTFPPGTQVMLGIFKPWSSIHDDVIAEVRRLAEMYPDYSLETTGHSLGGSLTYLSYIALAQNFPDKDITSNALAAFAIGNGAFADFGSSQQGLLRRGNNFLDGVPNMYPQFTHYGVEWYGKGTAGTTVQCDGERDLLCSAGDGQFTVTLGHLQSFGIAQALSGCG